MQKGKFLASGSPQDSSLYIWNVENREATLLQKIRGGGYTFLTWSPTGNRLLACTPGNVFKFARLNYLLILISNANLIPTIFLVQNMGNPNMVGRDLGCDEWLCSGSSMESLWNKSYFC